jgi:hypothetical protein
MKLCEYPHKYKVYDIVIVSRIKLFDLTHLDNSSLEFQDSKVVRLEIGDVPTELKGAVKLASWMDANASECLCKVPGGSRFIVREGFSIVVDTDDAETSQRTRDYIVGIGLPVIAHQRAHIPLHVSMVDTPYGIWAFAGKSGAGKSTTAIAISKKKGWRLLCDDLAILNVMPSGSIISFGVNKIKLWGDAAADFGYDTASLRRDPVRTEKYHVTVDPVDSMPLYKLNKLVHLIWSEAEQSVVEMRPAISFQMLMNCIHLPEFISINGNLNFAQRTLYDISSGIKSFEHKRIKDQFNVDQSIELVFKRLLE